MAEAAVKETTKVKKEKKKKEKNPNSRGSRAFAYAQQIGKSLFLPIAILPFAGILLGIGSSFTNPTTIAAYGLEGALHPGSFLYGLMEMFAGAGNVVFGNLAFIFALAVGMGMAKKEKAVNSLMVDVQNKAAQLTEEAGTSVNWFLIVIAVLIVATLLWWLIYKLTHRRPRFTPTPLLPNQQA